MRIFILILFLLTQIVHAETCPKAIDVQKNETKGWQVYDSDSDEPVSAKRESMFRLAAKEFALAEWVDSGKNKGTMHCYYRDADGSNFESYLAKTKFILSSADKSWYQVTGSMQCAANNVNRCNFLPQPIEQMAQK